MRKGTRSLSWPRRAPHTAMKGQGYHQRFAPRAHDGGWETIFCMTMYIYIIIDLYSNGLMVQFFGVACCLLVPDAALQAIGRLASGLAADVMNVQCGQNVARCRHCGDCLFHRFRRHLCFKSFVYALQRAQPIVYLNSNHRCYHRQRHCCC